MYVQRLLIQLITIIITIACTLYTEGNTAGSLSISAYQSTGDYAHNLLFLFSKLLWFKCYSHQNQNTQCTLLYSTNVSKKPEHHIVLERAGTDYMKVI